MMIPAMLSVSALAGIIVAATVDGHVSQPEPSDMLKTIATSTADAQVTLAERIVGGDEVTTAKPWMVSIRKARNGKYRHVCGGTLISSTFVLTAAHCVEDAISDPHMLNAWVGGVAMSEPREFKKAAVAKVFLPPKRTGAGIAYDIAILQLNTQIEGKTVALPSANDSVAAGEFGTVYGWGVPTVTNPGDEKTRPVVLSNRLRAVSLEVETDKACSFIYSTVDSAQAFCAHGTTSPKDACQGDSGGPFIISNDVQFGIVSAGSGCGLAMYPGVYTRVASHMAWIEQTLSANKDLAIKVLGSDNGLRPHWQPSARDWAVLAGALLATTLALVTILVYVSRRNRRKTIIESSFNAGTP